MVISAQTLESIGGFPFEVAHSRDVEDQARESAELVARALPVLSHALGFSPRLQLVVLSRADWPRHATRPIFGSPQNLDGDTIVIGSEAAGFWADVVTMIEPSLSALERSHLRAVYGERDGEIDIRPFTSLVVLHQLGHIFHQQVPFEFPRRWLRELFANLCAYTAVADALPERLPYLETLPQSLSETPSQLATRRTLAEFDDITVDDGVENFVWYQFRLVLAAKAIHEAAGPASLRRFFDLFLRCCDRPLADGELADLLELKVAPEAAMLMRNWPHVASESVPAL